MTRIISILAIVLMVGAAVGLYRFKDQASERAGKIDTLRTQISEQRDAINVLRAEWNYLNQPKRIQELSERYLDIGRLEISQITSIDALPMRPLNLEPYESNRLGGFAGGGERVVQ